MSLSTSKNISSNERIHGYDVVRGFSSLSMVGFHFCYDLTYIKGIPMPWFVGTWFQDFWRATIAWTFLLLAGIMVSYSRSNFIRAGKYLLVAALIWLVTSFAMPSEAISFGIIYCMGASTLIAALLELTPLSNLSSSAYGVLAALLFALFIPCLHVPWGTFGLEYYGGPYVDIPQALYNGWSSWLGFMSADFFSADYYPIIPYTLLFLCGTCLGHLIKAKGAPLWLRNLRSKPLEFIGRHALEVYVLHQPVLLLICELIRL